MCLLDEKTFMAFELYGLQNRKVDTVADILEMTPNQIYVAKNRCLNILQKIITTTEMIWVLS